MKENQYFWSLLILVMLIANIIGTHFSDLGQSNETLYGIYMFIIFLIINYSFFKAIKELISKEYSMIEVYKKFKVIIVYGASNIIVFANIYYYYGICEGDYLVQRELLTSLYFSIVTWTTLGYGDFNPVSSLRLVASIEALMGYLYMALIIGFFLNIIKIKIK